MPSPRRLAPRRGRNLLITLGAAALTAGATWLAMRAWSAGDKLDFILFAAGVGIFGLGTLVWMMNLVPGWQYLAFDREGITYRTDWRRWRWRWQDISPVSLRTIVVHTRRSATQHLWLVFEWHAARRGALPRLKRLLWGRWSPDEMIPADDFVRGKQEADRLVTEMNAYRAAALGQSRAASQNEPAEHGQA